MTWSAIVFRPRCSACVLLWVGISILTACSTPPPAKGDGEAFTHIRVRDEDDADGRIAFYEISGDTLAFAGGLAAMRETPETTESLDRETMGEVMDAIRKAGWLAATPPTSIGDGPRSLSVDMTWRGGRRTFRIDGNGRELPSGSEAVVVLLKQIADRRFAEIINSLPRGR